MEIDGIAALGRGLTAKGPEGIVFANVDLQVRPGDLTVITGPGGTGRTTLLLALCGRMRLLAGHLEVAGKILPSGARAVRRLVLPARASPGFELEPNHRVREAVAEHRSVNRIADADLDRACELVGLELTPRALIRELPAVERTLLALALCASRRPAGLVLDDVEAGLPLGQRARVWGALHTLTRTGMTVVASATDPPATPVDVVRLPPPADVFGPGGADERTEAPVPDARPRGRRGDTEVLPTVEDPR
ncbi:hypothetical protein GCM10027174_06020 [Salinifilum aidingensis]